MCSGSQSSRGILTEKEPHLVAGQLTVAGRCRGIGDGRREPVSIRVVGDDEFGTDLSSQSEGLIKSPASSGFGKSTVGGPGTEPAARSPGGGS
jgi:hypothetical protein